MIDLLINVFYKKKFKNLYFCWNILIGFVRCWICENRKIFLDEIDFDFIKIIIKYMEDVLIEVCNILLDISYGRGKMV